MFRLTIGRRLGLTFAVALSVAAIVAALLMRHHGNTEKDRALDSLEAVVESLSAGVDREMARAARQVEFAATDLETRAVNEVDERLKEIGFPSSEVVSEEALKSGDLQIDTNFAQRIMTDTAFGSVDALPDGSHTMTIGAPIAGGQFEGGVLIANYDLDPVFEILKATRTGDSLEALLGSQIEGLASFFSPSRHFNDRIPTTSLAASERLVDAIESDEITRIGSTDDFGRSSTAAVGRVDGPQWALVVSLDRVDSLSTSLAWLLLGFVVVGGLTIGTVVPVKTRIKSVLQGARRLGRGDPLTKLPDDGSDEIGSLARALHRIEERLRTDDEQRGRSAALLQHRATHDPLTGLANRARLMDELSKTLEENRPTAVIFCDIDDFKGINDSHGHGGGDTVLKFVADQLASVCSPNDLIARFGGDEFCVLTNAEPQNARSLAQKVDRALDTNVVVGETTLLIGGSVGLAIAKVTDSADTLLRSADLAMYREKERRRGLRRAHQQQEEPDISPEQIRLAFQPVVEIMDGQIIGVEVLARYMHPDLGLLDPSSFLPPGTEQGMFDKFDFEILSRSIAQLSDWIGQGVVDERFTMSINLSPDHVSDTDSTRQIFEILRQYRVDPSLLQIEVTEHTLQAHEDDLLRSLNSLRERGIKIAIDDFGIEGSNVDRLIQMPSDVVKIDRSFVSEIDIDEKAESRLRAIVEIVTTEGRKPIAEGVERAAQARILREMNVPLGQGYFWHAPISALALTPLLGRASRWTRQPRGRSDSSVLDLD